MEQIVGTARLQVKLLNYGIGEWVKMAKLKPCPLCGGKAMLDKEEIFCGDCHLMLPIQLYVLSYTSVDGFPTYDEARKNMIELWNKREK